MLSSIPAFAITADRTLWIYEHYSEAPRPTLNTKTRYQLAGQLNHFAETTALRLQGVLDLRVLEIALSGNQLLFPSDSQQSLLAKQPLYQMRQTLGAEIARYFATETRHYGRFALGTFHFFPTPETWLRLGLETGILAPNGGGWEFGFRTRLLVPLQRNERYLLAKTSVLRSLDFFGDSVRLSAGGVLSWTWALRDTTVPGNYEHMLISVGPIIDLGVGANSHLEAGLQFRLWMDKLVTHSATGVNETTVSEIFGVPAVYLNWCWTI